MLHIPVLKKRVLEKINFSNLKVVIDGTFGYGGHLIDILKTKNNENTIFIGLDKDDEAYNFSRNKFKFDNLILENIDFKDFDLVIKKHHIKKVSLFFLDLGISSPQVDNGKRGFSYNKDALLDMRMDQKQKLSAYEVVNKFDKEKLAKIFLDYGQVKANNKIAYEIVKNRPIKSTLELVKLIKKVTPQKLLKQKNVAKQVFQAIRIYVNNELDSLKIFLDKVLNFLDKKGQIFIITYHSLEDKIVKTFFNSLTENKTGKLPINEIIKYKKYLIKPNEKEILKNSRSRSARLRVLEKIC